MKAIVKYISSKKEQEAEIYTSFVYLCEDAKAISKVDFDDFFEIVKLLHTENN